MQPLSTHSGTLQHIATHCNTLQRTATHCNALQHTSAHCSTLQHTAAHVCTLKPAKMINIQHTDNTTTCDILQHTATYCNTLQHIATLCSILQHTAIHCNTLQHTCVRSNLHKKKKTCSVMKVVHWLNESYLYVRQRGGGLGSRPKKMYGERLGDGVEYHSMKPTPRR